jgi:DNA repair photolyase
MSNLISSKPNISKLVQRHYKEVKKAIKKEKFANPFTLGKYSLAPYMACEHGCLYCDGRAERYYVQGDFAKDIVVRKNLPDLFETELPKLREKGIIAIGSGITDPYQPTEDKEKIVQRIAKTIEKNGFPATLLTKSSLILRDLDIWKKVNEKAKFILLISLTFSDDKLRQIFEPRASSVAERFHVIQKFKENNIPVGVLAIPFLPYISDTQENVSALYENLNALGVDFIIPGGLTLRPGRQKETYLDIINQQFPDQLNSIKQIYSENRPSGSPAASYYSNFGQEIARIEARFNIPNVAPHRLYQGMMPKYDEIFILLNHMKDLYMKRGVDVDPLNKAIGGYASWLKKEKTFYNRRRKIEDNYVDIQLEHQCRTGGFSNIIKNKKLEAFLLDVILNRKTFDPISLQLKSDSTI